MSMIVGINLIDYAIMAADKREVLIENGNIQSVRSDEVQKIIAWGGGFITGSGYVPLLGDLKELISNSKISNTDQIVKLAQQSVLRLPESMGYWKNQTNWMFTYSSEVSGNKAVRVAQIESRSPDQIRLLHEMHSTVWAKLPNLDAKIKELTAMLKHSSEFSNLTESIQYHLNLLPNLFQYGSEADKSVCKGYNYSLLFKDGSRYCS